MTMANTTEEPILFRMDRVDTILRQLEEIRRLQSRSHSHSYTHTPKSSSLTSTPSGMSGTLTSEGGNLPSSAELISPESLEKHCRPIEHVMMETDAKGSLIERLDHVEDRVLKLCVQLEEDFMESSAEKKRDDEAEMIKMSEKEREEMIRRSEKEEKIDISEIERTLDHVEDRVLKLCEQLEEEFMESSAEKKRDDEAEMIKRSKKKREEVIRRSENDEKVDISEIERTQIDAIKKTKKGLKQLVKQCVMGKGKSNKSTNL